MLFNIEQIQKFLGFYSLRIGLIILGTFMLFNKERLNSLNQEHRRNLMNLVSGVKSAHLIGTYNHNGVSNLGVFNSVVHIGAKPPLLGFIQRPLTVDRQTYRNIKKHGHYTLNAISSKMVDMAHQCSAKYEDGVSEFEATGLNAFLLDNFNAPFVEESPIKIGLRFVEEQPIQANGCILVVGEIEFLSINLENLTTDGFFQLDELGLVGIGGLDSYYSIELIERKNFARP